MITIRARSMIPFAAASCRHALRDSSPSHACLLAHCAARLAAPSSAAAATYAGRADVRAFIDEMVSEHGYDRARAARAFAAARFQPRIVEAMQRPLLEPPKWYEYAPPFLSPARVDGGVAYWNANAAELARAEERFGVPAGNRRRHHRRRNVLRAQHRQSSRARRAVDARIRLSAPRGVLSRRAEAVPAARARAARGSPLSPKGSFAGALGVPQFMPGSYREFAVDFDGDGRIDLWAQSPPTSSAASATISRGTTGSADSRCCCPAAIAEDSLPPRCSAPRRRDQRAPHARSVGRRRRRGGRRAARPGTRSGRLADARGKDADGVEGASYWIACQNFYVLTRYNRSRLYAAAVYELARAIKAARDDAGPR